MPYPRRYTEPTVAVTVRLPESLINECKILAVDPATGRALYGFWTRAVEYGLREWLKSKKVPAP